MKKLIAALALAFGSAQCVAEQAPKNIILVIGDGMGPVYTTAYRNFKDDRNTPQIENTIFDEMLVGMASTYSYGTQKDHTDNTYVTDSAAAATALSTGVKTYNQAVALNVEDKPLQTLMEYAKSKDKTTGLVVLSQINHATPASFVAHNTYRYNYNQIADNFFDNRVAGKFVADLMLGGGQKYFIREDRNIVEQFKQAGYHYYDNYSQLNSIDKLPALGLFAKKGMSYAIDSNEKYRLRAMVEKALTLLEQSKKGYFLLVEASLIDWCGHANDIACAMNEMDDLAQALELLNQYAKKRQDTLVVATADHNTGGLSLGRDGEYRWYPEKVKQITNSAEYMAQQVMDGAHVLKVWMNSVSLPIKPDQLTGIAEVRQQARAYVKEQKAKLDDPLNAKAIASLESEGVEMIANYITGLLSEVTLTGWTSTGHSGSDVQVFAQGPGAQHFFGHQDNTDIGKQLFKLIK